MTAVIGSISVANRLRTLVAFALLGLAAVAGFALSTLNSSLYDSRQDSLQRLVESAHSIVVEHDRLVQQGVLTKEQAQQRAMDALRHVRYEGDNYFWITDTRSQMLMHPFKPKLENTSVAGFEDPNGVRLFAEITKIAQSDGEGFVAYHWPRPGQKDPSAKLSYVKAYQPWGWIVGTGVYTDDIESSFWELFTQLSLAFVGIATAMVVGGILIGRSIASPLNRMAELMRHVQESGDISQRINIDQQGEIGEIGKAFDGMLGSVGDFVNNIHQSSNQLASSAQQLATVAEQTNTSISQQRMQTTQVATAMTEMSATVAEIAGSTNETALATQGADHASDEGQGVVKSSLQAIDSLAGDIRNTNAVVQRLSDNTESVGTVLDVIGGIAEQTNLLALNAAIEAARAGEQGRGFAVVADEVRTLAQRTQDSTQEIQSIISSVQAAAREVVAAMSSGMQQAETSVQHAEQANSKLLEINEAVNHIKDMTTQIATAAEEQSVVAEDVSRNINQIDGISGDNAQGAQQIAEASQELSSLAELLQEHARHFRTS